MSRSDSDLRMMEVQKIRQKLAALAAGRKLTWPEPQPEHWGPGGGKVFCVGRNKTGTTSLAKAFRDLGYMVGHQPTAEAICNENYFERRFGPIVDYCKSAQVFQDAPFSYPHLFVHLDQAFPGSKFILSVRDDPEQWYRSVTRFHAKKWGTDGATPTAAQLKVAPYRTKGFGYNVVKVHGTTDENPYDKETMIEHYKAHNRAVQDYFKYRPNDLLVVNVAHKEDYGRLVEFLGVSSALTDFPKENVT